MIILKVTTKPELQSISRKHIFGKTTGDDKLISSLFRVNLGFYPVFCDVSLVFLNFLSVIYEPGSFLPHTVALFWAYLKLNT